MTVRVMLESGVTSSEAVLFCSKHRTKHLALLKQTASANKYERNSFALAFQSSSHQFICDSHAARREKVRRLVLDGIPY